VNFQMGYASALAWMLFAVTMVCTVVIIKTSKRWVHYAGGGGFR
jgi:multiple sugar transport system permease protein